MHPARMLVLAVLLVACKRQPSANLELEDPHDPHEPVARTVVVDAPNQHLDARMQSMCAHSYAVLSGENQSLRSPDIERDFIARCIDGNRIKLSELGEQQWAARASCIERATTGDDLGRCDGRTPKAEPNPVVVSTASNDARALCQRVFDILIRENPDFAQIMDPAELEKIMEECAVSAEQERLADPIKFDRQAQCILAAQTTADFEKCED